jgi:hypothetical protein
MCPHRPHWHHFSEVLTMAGRPPNGTDWLQRSRRTNSEIAADEGRVERDRGRQEDAIRNFFQPSGKAKVVKSDNPKLHAILGDSILSLSN